MRSPTLAAAFAGSLSLALGYAAARRTGLTHVDLAERVLPGRPLLGRAFQLAAGTAACLPAATLGTPRRGLVAGAVAGGMAASTLTGPLDRALTVALHGLAGGAAATIRRAALAPRRGG